MFSEKFDPKTFHLTSSFSKCSQSILNYLVITSSDSKNLKKIFRLVLVMQLSLLRYVVSGDLRCVSSLSLNSGTLVMFGTGDGALTSLALADPDKKDNAKAIRVMRQKSS